MKKSVVLFFMIISLFFSSCEGDCKEYQIEKVEWVTSYVDKTKDTLVAYSITQNERKYISYDEMVEHAVTIHNNNRKYNGRFSLKINYDHYDYEVENRVKTFGFVSIPPNGSHTFTYRTQVGRYVNYNNSYTILQQPVSYTYKERKDELQTEMITVNDCSDNVEALRQKYKTIKELYQTKMATNEENDDVNK